MSLVRHGLVFAGLIITKFFGAAIGISAFPTAELYGPIMPRYLLSSSIWRTLATPASALYAPWRQSSKLWYAIWKPSTPPAAFFWSTANLTPLAVDWPPVVQTGRSEPILMVPLLPPVVGVVPPQANATSVATVRTTSPLARTIWFPLVRGWEAVRATTPVSLPVTCRPLPGLSTGRECAGGECGHMRMAELTTPSTLSTCGALQVKSKVKGGIRLNTEDGRCSRAWRPASTVIWRRRPAPGAR